MYRIVLLAYDESPPGKLALRHAASLAGAFKARLHVLGVVNRSLGISFAQAGGMLDALEPLRTRLERAIAAAAQSLRAEGLEVYETLLEGEPDVEIARYARQINADVAVLAHIRESSLQRFFGGGPTPKMPRGMPCSVLVTMERGSPS